MLERHTRREIIEILTKDFLIRRLTIPTSHIRKNRITVSFFLSRRAPSDAARCTVSHLTQGRGYDSTELCGVNTILVGSIGSVRVVPSCWALGASSIRARRPFIRLTRKTMWPSASDWYAILSTYCNTTLRNIPRVFSALYCLNYFSTCQTLLKNIF